jgi:hypothetical protein
MVLKVKIDSKIFPMSNKSVARFVKYNIAKQSTIGRFYKMNSLYQHTIIKGESEYSLNPFFGMKGECQ